MNAFLLNCMKLSKLNPGINIFFRINLDENDYEQLYIWIKYCINKQFYFFLLNITFIRFIRKYIISIEMYKTLSDLSKYFLSYTVISPDLHQNTLFNDYFVKLWRLKRWFTKIINKRSFFTLFWMLVKVYFSEEKVFVY